MFIPKSWKALRFSALRFRSVLRFRERLWRQRWIAAVSLLDRNNGIAKAAAKSKWMPGLPRG
jgi:hypothetical protein